MSRFTSVFVILVKSGLSVLKESQVISYNDAVK